MKGTGRRVLVAMSGGVDSSAAVYLLREQGYDCVGATMELYGTPAETLEDARAAAERMKKPLVLKINSDQILHKTDAGGVKLNINTADAAALCTLPGIGESRARDIISYREANGGFGACEDIMKVSGIKTAAYEKIKDKITVK